MNSDPHATGAQSDPSKAAGSSAPRLRPAPSARNGALWVMLGILAVIGGGLSIWTAMAGKVNLGLARGRQISKLGDSAPTRVPPFSFTDPQGRTIGLDTLEGHVWIANFIFTRCGGTCPIMSGNMARVQSSVKKMPQIWPPILLVSFSVDPEWDTPQVLAQYARNFKADPDRWFFLRGTWAEVQDLAVKGFKMGLQDGAESELEPIIHSQSFALVDGRGRIRGYYDGTDPTGVHRLLADAQAVARERP